MTGRDRSNNPGRAMVKVVTGMACLKIILAGTLWLVCLAVALGFGGALHPAGDSLALLRLPLGILCLCAVLVVWRGHLRRVLVLSAGAAMVTTLPPLFAGTGAGDLTVYSKNLWYRNDALPALSADIIASRAEVVMLQEVSQRNDRILAMLADTYPHQHVCRFSGWSGIAVLSREPIAETACSDRRALAAARIDHRAGSFWAVAVHLPWPYPYDNAQAADAAAVILSRLDGPVVMAGDFNIFPWASSVQRLQTASGTRTVGPVRPTYSLRGVPLLLDHVHAPGGGQVEYRALLGSDHRGVLATVRLHR